MFSYAELGAAGAFWLLATTHGKTERQHTVSSATQGLKDGREEAARRQAGSDLNSYDGSGDGAGMGR